MKKQTKTAKSRAKPAFTPCQHCDSADEVEQYRHRVAILEREARAARATIVQLSEAVRVLELSNKAMGMHMLMKQEAAQS